MKLTNLKNSGGYGSIAPNRTPILTLMLQVAKMMQKNNWKMIGTLAQANSSDGTQWELSNEYPHDRVWIQASRLTQTVTGPVGPETSRIYWYSNKFTGSTNFSLI